MTNTMKQRKTPEDLACGIVITMKVLGSKWKPCIIDAIHRGFHRPSEIQREIHSAPARVIEMQLRELELYGIVTKTIYPERPLRSEYSITKTGESLLPLIAAIDRWGNQNRHILDLHPQYGSMVA